MMTELKNEAQKQAYESCIYSLALGTPIEIMTMILEEHVSEDDFDMAEGFKWAISDWFFAQSFKEGGLGCQIKNELNRNTDWNE